ncbi:hypothetical protein CI789_06755 [Erwinia persicina]|uniref:ATP-binding protein n=1 Tax=Erwinia persicina TaxID=55211 RepID=UPI000E4AC41E|nr:ATP-binding protein [Erwinia persicina]AXU94950.1 hypothetical protein CI789_06755 [Erwinia persicina]
MELVFVYVEEHKILKDFHALFSSDYNITLLDSVLSIEHVKDTTFDYYKGCNINAVVGQNGTGKSTLLDFIEESCARYSESSGFIIWYDAVEKEIIIHDMNASLQYINIKSCLKYKVIKNNKNLFEKTDTKIFKINNMATSGFNSINKRRKNIIDCSLGTQSKYRGKKRSINLRRMLDFFNNSLWLKSKQAKYSYSFEFKAPSSSIQKWVLGILDDDNKNLTRKQLDSIHADYEAKLFYLKPLFQEDASFTVDSIFQSLLKRNIYSFIKAMPSMRISNPIVANKVCLEFVRHYVYSERIEFAEVVKIVKKVHHENEYESKAFDLFDFSEVLDLHFSKFFRSLEHVSNAIYDATGYQASAHDNKLKSYYHEAILNVLEALSKLHPCVINNFQYGWEGFSTGELAKLNIFSSLYNIYDEYLGNNALVIIDEVDLYLHPEWQRTFVSELISFISKTDFNAKLQIILTTHSPIIIGDFLPKDIISLRLNKNGIPEKALSFGFGTGITEAYVLGMHIKSTYGEHSRLKLMSIINNKLNGELTKQDKILIKQISNAELKESMLK